MKNENYEENIVEEKTLQNSKTLKVYFNDGNSKFFTGIKDMTYVEDLGIRLDFSDRKDLIVLENVNFLENNTGIRIKKKKW